MKLKFLIREDKCMNKARQLIDIKNQTLWLSSKIINHSQILKYI